MDKAASGIMDNSLANSGRSRRKWKNFFVKPKYQMKYTWHQIAGGLVFFSVASIMVLVKVGEIDALMDQTKILDLSTQVQITRIYVEMVTIFMVVFAGYIFYACMLMLVVSHRVSGPTIAIVATIEELIKGNYGFKRPLRNHDELGAIQHVLQELSENLKEKNEA